MQLQAKFSYIKKVKPPNTVNGSLIRSAGKPRTKRHLTKRVPNLRGLGALSNLGELPEHGGPAVEKHSQLVIKCFICKPVS